MTDGQGGLVATERFPPYKPKEVFPSTSVPLPLITWQAPPPSSASFQAGPVDASPLHPAQYSPALGLLYTGTFRIRMKE